MKRLIQLLRQPMNRRDLLRVILYGLVSAIGGGLIFGLLQGLMIQHIKIKLLFLVIFMAILIGNNVNRARRHQYHIVYPILGVVFFVLGYFFFGLTVISYLNHDVSLLLTGITKSIFWEINFIFLNPSAYFIDTRESISFLVDLIIFIYSIVYTYRMIKRYNY